MRIARPPSPQLPKGVKEGDIYEDMRPDYFIWYFFNVLDDDLRFWWPDGDGDDGDGNDGDCGGLDELFMAPPPPISCLSHLTPDSTSDNHHDFEERRLKREIVHPPLLEKVLIFFSIFWTTCLKARMWRIGPKPNLSQNQTTSNIC